MDAQTSSQHWPRTKALMIQTLSIWFFFAFVVHIFVYQLNSITILGFPIGFYMAARGSLVAFVVLVFWFSWRQEKIDEECGVAEDL